MPPGRPHLSIRRSCALIVRTPFVQLFALWVLGAEQMQVVQKVRTKFNGFKRSFLHPGIRGPDGRELNYGIF